MSNIFPVARIHPLLIDPTVNLTFEEILDKDDDEFRDYVRHMRQSFLSYWDNENLAPRRGWSEDEIDKEFAELAGTNVNRFWRVSGSGEKVIRNTQTSLGGCVNAWMAGDQYRCRINYSEKDDGRSIYDFFAKPELFDRYLPYARRHFLRDSFYLFAESVLGNATLPHQPGRQFTSAVEYIQAFLTYETPYDTDDLLIEPVLAVKSGSYSGYGDKLTANKPMSLTYAEYVSLRHTTPVLTDRQVRNVLPKHMDTSYVFHVRKYAKRQRLFPALFRSFRISMCQYAVNFPPLTAKLIYETYLSHVTSPTVRVYDPSAGWAGRLIGAMSYNRTLPSGDLQHLEYYATDPNPAFYKEGTSVYAEIAERYNRVRIGNSLFDTPHHAEVFQLGSEFWDTTDPYKRFCGQGDLVFTSPPYFAKEAYSEDENQSYKRYSTYERWRDEFLQPTLTHAFAWLNHERYLLWNIADVKFGKNRLPLEDDSIRIAEALGFVFKGKILMTLAGMPGANRKDDNGNATTKNFCMLSTEKGIQTLKYEPIFVFWKP